MPARKISLHQANFIESAFETAAFGRGTHDAGVHAGRQREITEARRSEILAIEAIQDF